jgi:cytochrome c553
MSKYAHLVLVCVLAGFVPGQLTPCQAQPQLPFAARIPTGKIAKKGIQNTPETLLGERLFLETRFAQFFAAHYNGDVNQPLAQGDEVVAQVKNPRAGVPYPGPFAGKSINCRSCHFVDEFSTFIAGTNRSYTDFVPHSPIPARDDGQTMTPRNSRTLVDAFLPGRPGTLLHADGEFVNAATLIEGTFTGRNFGWLPTEQGKAIHHIAKVIREDDGRDSLAQEYGGSYAKLMLGTAEDLPDKFRIASGYRIDVRSATDRQILDEVARLVAAYLNSLLFERNAEGAHTGSPYDMFLAKNGLPVAPAAGETDAQYSQRLSQALEQLQSPKFVQPYERWAKFHTHVFQFRERELAGLKIFLRQGVSAPESQKTSAKHTSPLFLLAGLPLFGVLLGRAKGARRLPSDWLMAVSLSMFLCAVMAAALGSPAIDRVQAASDSALHVGNCVSCHSAPEFTDFRFHNTGATQEEYDSLHGQGSFAQLPVPSYAERSRYPNRYLPATPVHPTATGVFRSVPVVSNPSQTDLGVWNIFANSDFPGVQSQMRRLLCGTGPCDPNRQLPQTIALFRTPSLRDLGHAAPYLHTGQMNSVEDVLHFYVRMAALARSGQLRNGDPKLSQISLDEQDITALAAFLRSLDEDYDN